MMWPDDLALIRPKNAPGVAIVELTRPTKRNAITKALWEGGFRRIFAALEEDDAVLSIVLRGRGEHFTAGVDLDALAGVDDIVNGNKDACPAAARRALYEKVLQWQDAFTSIEQCSKPVIAAVDGVCIGAGVDLICACDIRICTQRARFSVKEVDVGLAADVGTLQRLPPIVGYGNAMALALTGKTISGSEAYRIGLCSECVADSRALERTALDIAVAIAKKPRVAVAGTKRILQHARDHSVQSSLDYNAVWSAAFLPNKALSRNIATFRSKL